jgi:DNA-binding FadR family transcriptional regulator
MTDAPLHEVRRAVYRPVREGNALEDTVARLVQTIRLGVVAPGESLPSERELAVLYAVSRDTVREAIRELSEAGYLTSKRGRYGGTFVTDPLPPPPVVPAVAPTASEIEDVVGLREILEVGSVRAAATRSLGAEERALLWTRLGEVQAAAPDDYRRLDSRLHLAFAEIVGVPSLVTLLADNRSRVNELLDTFPLLARTIEHSNRQHEAIVFAILAGNEQGAAEAMREHLEASAVLLRGFLA